MSRSSTAGGILGGATRVAAGPFEDGPGCRGPARSPRRPAILNNELSRNLAQMDNPFRALCVSAEEVRIYPRGVMPMQLPVVPNEIELLRLLKSAAAGFATAVLARQNPARRGGAGRSVQQFSNWRRARALWTALPCPSLLK
jgi:hypothetical protein